MSSYKAFAGIFLLCFFAASIPFMFGYGIVIDFQKGTNPLWILLLYMKEGLLYKIIEKVILSLLISVGVQLYLKRVKM